MRDRIRQAVQDEARLRQAVREADIVPLLLVLTQLTGDDTLLRAAAPHIKGAWSFQQDVPELLQDEIRKQLITALEAAAGGTLTVPPLNSETMRQWMSLGAGSEVSAEYVPMLIEEARFLEHDSRAVAWRRTPAPDQLESARVIIVGAGMSGICTAIRLKQMGIPFVILEKNATLGGTWLENTYPGVAVDVASHYFSYSFATESRWSRHFSPGGEVLAYLKRCAERFGIVDHIRFSTNATAASFDPSTATWSISCEDAGGGTERVEGRFLVCAVGQLNQPFIPAIEGLQDFAGPAFHTARWNHDVPLAGRKVAIVGTGASAMQVAPALAPDVAKLTIFQRTPHWVMHNPNYHKDVRPAKKWAMQHIPLYSEWYRFLLFWGQSDGFHRMLHVDPAWPHRDISLNRENHQMRENLIAWITAELEGDETLLAKVIPGYPPYGKRMLRDNHWYRMLKRPNVELVVEPIARAVPGGLVCRDGTRHDADVLVFSTGFQASRMIWPLEVRGVDGMTLRSLWGDDDPRAYLGITVPKFPNMFIVYGPNTNLAHGGSIIFHTECQVRYITSALREMIEGGHRAFDCRPGVHDAFNRRLDEQHSRMVWAHAGVTSWYKNRRNRVTMTSPWRLVDYWRMTRDFVAGEYILT